MIQQYVGVLTEQHHCRMVSISDAFTPNGRTKVQIIWDLSIKAIDAGHCEYTNSVTAHPSEEFLAFLDEYDVSFETAAANRQAAGGDHDHRETLLFAESMKRKALARK